MRREKLMVAAQYDPALMQKLLAENSAEQIATAPGLSGAIGLWRKKCKIC
jgi:hypothetical protein